MPQLNPNPWLPIMVFCWLVLLGLIIPKTLSHTFTNDPSPRDTQTCGEETWTWPWP